MFLEWLSHTHTGAMGRERKEEANVKKRKKKRKREKNATGSPRKREGEKEEESLQLNVESVLTRKVFSSSPHLFPSPQGKIHLLGARAERRRYSGWLDWHWTRCAQSAVVGPIVSTSNTTPFLIKYQKEVFSVCAPQRILVLEEYLDTFFNRRYAHKK